MRYFVHENKTLENIGKNSFHVYVNVIDKILSYSNNKIDQYFPKN